ncbi:MAG: hypothetical protein WC477_01575 [Patescibacteria group bacterium]
MTQPSDRNSDHHADVKYVASITYSFRSTPFHAGNLPEDELSLIARRMPKLARDRCFPGLAIPGTVNVKQLMKSCVDRATEGRANDLRNFLFTYGILIETTLSEGQTLFLFDAEQLNGILKGFVQLIQCDENNLRQRARYLIAAYQDARRADDESEAVEVIEPPPVSKVVVAPATRISPDEIVLALLESPQSVAILEDNQDIRECVGSPLEYLEAMREPSEAEDVRIAFEEACRQGYLICLPSPEACTGCLVSIYPWTSKNMQENLQRCLAIFRQRPVDTKSESKQLLKRRLHEIDATYTEQKVQRLQEKRLALEEIVQKETQNLVLQQEEAIRLIQEECERRIQQIKEQTQASIKQHQEGCAVDIRLELGRIEREISTSCKEERRRASRMIIAERETRIQMLTTLLRSLEAFARNAGE